ncbi:MAG: adenylosuccinate lyase [Chloroflexota bacterium]|nr:adenylosuccinate lyase [Dehalococcoidia bacterium]MDW8253342.1 adenylosuccinate lyase [Chloroflexota bacterium]
MIERYTRPVMGAIWTERHKLDLWLKVEIAACEGWAALGVIPPDDLAVIRSATYDLDDVARYFRETHHDMTAFLRSVQERLGAAGRWIHYGLTSSDVMDTALSLQLMEAMDLLLSGVDRLEQAITALAVAHWRTPQIGRTHGVHAEPMSFGLKLAVWIDEVRRGRERLRAARSRIAVGKLSGAVGSHALVPPEVEEIACASLGLTPAAASTQVLQRDRHAEYVLALALLAASLEKFATELRALQRTEVLETEEPFEEGQTGSSAMPHKRNPELAERITGLARVVRGHAVTALENVALWHERDISHSSTERIILPDSSILLDYMLDLLAGILERLQVYPDRMRENIDLTRGLVYSQRVLLALVERGLTRQEAYAIVQRHAMRAWRTRENYRDLLAADPAVTAVLSPEELDALFDPTYYLRYADVPFRRLGIPLDEAVSRRERQPPPP